MTHKSLMFTEAGKLFINAHNLIPEYLYNANIMDPILLTKQPLCESDITCFLHNTPLTRIWDMLPITSSTLLVSSRPHLGLLNMTSQTFIGFGKKRRSYSDGDYREVKLNRQECLNHYGYITKREGYSSDLRRIHYSGRL